MLSEQPSLASGDISQHAESDMSDNNNDGGLHPLPMPEFGGKPTLTQMGALKTYEKIVKLGSRLKVNLKVYVNLNFKVSLKV